MLLSMHSGSCTAVLLGEGPKRWQPAAAPALEAGTLPPGLQPKAAPVQAVGAAPGTGQTPGQLLVSGGFRLSSGRHVGTATPPSSSAEGAAADAAQFAAGINHNSTGAKTTDLTQVFKSSLQGCAGSAD